ncbi:hypothetical protein [Brevundimonas goettingensis]|uniref:Uncharacterized protein n=1 Tax=Brevundimonas goettingensis TaxID=2774190 RepID=A0A975BZL0_9CAUL|nr:hypothetical protein [Brevundimonas goettingensis]QTC90856.1 hypothetical protein IFJ75_16760 [Brevundimonas goettingensis]
MSSEFQSLLSAAFTTALSASRRESFLSDLIPEFRSTLPTKRLRDVFSIAGLSKAGEQLRVRQQRTGKGLALVWLVSGGAVRHRVNWVDLPNLSIPPAVSQVTSFIIRERAKLLFERATEAFANEIQRGTVTLMARRGSPLTDRSSMPSSACAHVVIDDWMKSVGRVASEPLFDIVVVPALDEEAVYREKAAAAGRVWTKLLPVVIEKLWPGGLPPLSRLSNRQFGDAVEHELRRLGIGLRELPHERTITDARKTYSGMRLEK